MMSNGIKIIGKEYFADIYAVLSLLPESVSKNNNLVLFPGFCDVHVHFREPGFSYKETIKSGTMAAAKGGYTAVCTMPNLNPVPDSAENLQKQLDIIKKDALINVYPYAAITKGQMGDELSDMFALAQSCIAFSDDGRGVQSKEMMRSAMIKANSLNKMIVAHCEDNSLLHKGYIHKGAYAAQHNHRGICSESEYLPILRDTAILREVECAYHVCHVSARQSVDAIRSAKHGGINITAETGPHYLVMDDSYLEEDGRFKMNPPLRDKADREALIEGIIDGTIDMIATDHAPHSAAEKAKGLENSAFGVVGLETAFPIMYTYLVKTGVIKIEKLIELMSINPRKRFGIPLNNDFTVWDLSAEYTVNPSDFLSLGKAKPFENWRVHGECVLTVCNGKTVYKK